MGLIAELRRRNVFRMMGLYLVGAWLITQVAGTLIPMFEAPAWISRSVVILLAIGFVPALVFAWVFELTPQGLKRDAEVAPEESIAPQTARRMDRMIIVVLVLALLYFGVDKFVLAPHREVAFVAPTVKAGAERPATATTALISKKSIAVLPFVDMSQGHDQEYFSEGIAEELLNHLAQITDLKVAARTSAFQFKGKDLDVADIGRQLKVAHVLEGSVRKDGARLRITAQLIDCASGYHLWSETFERDGADVFKVQDEISSAIAVALEAKLSGESVTATTRSADPAAYDDYLQGRAYFAKRVGDNLQKAVAAFDRAIAHDASYSPAHSGRAFALLIGDGWSPWLKPEVAIAQASASVDEALRLDPDNAEAYLARGAISATAFGAAQGRVDYERAYALAPGNVDVLNFYGDFLEVVGDLRGAERMKRQAMALDPLFFVHPMNLAEIVGAQGRFEEALAFGDRAVELGGGQFGEEQRFWALLGLKRFDDAAQSQAQTCRLAGVDSRGCVTQRAALLAAGGELPAARQIIADFGKRVARSSYARGRGLAMVYANYVVDIPAATAAALESLQNFDWPITEPLLLGPAGARLPEEISQDPAWLAAWTDPRLREVMDAYRANLLAYRKGN